MDSRATILSFMSLALKSVAEREPDDFRRANCWLSNERQRLHQSLYKLQAKFGKRLPILNDLHFMTRGAFPYSHELTAVMSQLCACGSLHYQSPDFRRFAPTWFDDSAQFLAEERRSMLETPEERQAFDAFVSDLREELKPAEGVA